MWRPRRGRGQDSSKHYEHNDSPKSFGNFKNQGVGRYQNSGFQQQGDDYHQRQGGFYRNQQNRNEHGDSQQNYGDYHHHEEEEEHFNSGNSFGRGRGRGRASFRGRSDHGSGQREMHLELSKPWVNPYLRSQIFIKYQLKDASSTSKTLSDFEKFQEQRANVEKITAMAKEAFFRTNPDQESYWLPILAEEFQRVVSHCELCDEDFDSMAALHQHEAEHQTCGLEGCTFTAHPKQLEDHIFNLHASGLYARMQSGDTPEEIEKWKAERKKNFPSVEKTLAAEEKRKLIRVQKHENYLARMESQRKYEEEKERQREEKRKRKMEENQDNTEDKHNNRKRKRARKTNQRFNDGMNESTEDTVGAKVEQKSDRGLSFDHNQRRGFIFPEDEKDEDVKGDLIKFCGTKSYLGSLKLEQETANIEQDDDNLDLDISDDEEWAHPATHQNSDGHKSESNHKEEVDLKSTPPEPTQKPAIYNDGSSTSSQLTGALPDASEPVPNSSSLNNPAVGEKTKSHSDDTPEPLPDQGEDDDDDAPLEVPISKNVLNHDESLVQSPISKTLCASNAARANSTCQPVSQNSKKPESKKPGKHGADPPKFKLVHKPRRNPTLLENLLSSEISHERSEILQCVKYVCDQNFFGIGKKTT